MWMRRSRDSEIAGKGHEWACLEAFPMLARLARLVTGKEVNQDAGAL